MPARMSGLSSRSPCSARPGDHRPVRVAQDDARAHLDQLVDEEQPALEHLLVDQDGALGLGGHDQRDAQQVGGKGRPGRVVDLGHGAVQVRRDGQALPGRHEDVVAANLDLDAQSLEGQQDHAQVLRRGVLDQDLASGRPPPGR